MPTVRHENAATWGGEGPNFTTFWKMAKDPHLGSTHFRNSVISEFRNVWRVGYDGQLLDINTKLRGAGEALTSPHFEKWPKTPTLGQRIFVIP